MLADVNIESGASLAVDGKGYAANQGMGVGQFSTTAGSGAGHGGYGGSGQPGSGTALGGMYYGSLMSPTTFGSGGRTVGVYPGGAGGGAVRLVVNGNLKLDGLIKADGTSGLGLGGGASGGSVWLTLGGISGTGGISANGGSGGLPYGGGGAGGRIAVTYHSNSFTGTFVAKGGAGSTPGSAGTIYTKLNSAAYADLVINNGGLTGTNAVLDGNDRFSLTLAGGGALRLVTSATAFGALEVGSNCVLLVGPFTSGSAGMTLSVASNATIAAGGRILGDGLGAPGGSGLGAGQFSLLGSTGAGHGGYGGRGAGFTNTAFAGGTIYDSTTSPGMPGSGGGGGFQSGGAGGAGLRLSVGGTLLLKGQLSVNGLSAATNNSGGGSGGGLTLTLNHFSGSGAIAADGGSGHLPFGGGGAGGRISITWNSNSFSGTYSAKGGNGFVPGGPGTICLRPNQRPTPDLIFDNGGLVGTNSVLDVSLLSSLTLGPGAIVMSSLPQVNVTSNLTIATNARLQANNLNLTAGSASIASGGRLAADAASSSGPGPGSYNPLGSSGGGYGGYGGRGAAAPSGGTAYGATLNPSLAGSPGGGPSGTSQSPAPGGGIVRMTVYGPMILDGQISANGASAPMNNSGGGSGGSVWLTLNQFSGSGSISANGGSGHLPNGGGGGGGRILVTWTSNSFTGDYSAKGGAGFVAGGAGTICLRANNTQTPDVIFDNGGLIGTNTVLDLPSLRNLTIASGASVTSSIAGVTISSNLTIGANATWRTRQLNLTASSVNIEAGGSFTADDSSPSGPGSGIANQSGSSGAGHGGYGGRGAGTTTGGNAYGFVSNPNQAGSPGANAGPGGPAAGGGALRLTVTGPLTLNGRISANGSSSVTNNGGGGSGGSVWLTLNQFLGTGMISADGGSGHLPNGGGGGGGRIALSFNTNAFSGILSAKGGRGFVGGGAGTIYLSTNNQRVATLIVDNGGLVGMNTPVDGSAAHLLIAGGAIAQPSLSQLTLTSLTIASNSALVAAPVGGGTLFLTVNTVNVATNGRITADGYGGAAMGTGRTGISGSGGGGHGGYGGRGAGSVSFGGESLGGNAYDLLATPGMTGGNGGGSNPGGIGGGALRMTVNGRFNLDGTISANGLSAFTNGGGGGAGGSLWLTLDELVGAGAIKADGGDGHLPNGGGGGGGRIAVSYNFLKGNFPTNGFTGSFSAQGGTGFVKGGAGTVFVRTNNSNIANVFVDNGGARGTNTLVAGTSGFDLHVQGGSVATNLGTPRDLFVRSNSWVIQSGNWSVSRNATLDAGGGIDLDGLGNSTVGRGSSFSNPKGGAGHGGYGGFHSPNSGNAYDLSASPAQDGSRGGNGSGSEGSSPFGGNGGGAAHLTVGSTLTLNGEVSADGNDGDFNSGGGSGGSLWIQAAALAGNGLITAKGGNGNGTAGGGGGGRIAVYFSTNNFTGGLSACGGAGGATGGAGTIYQRDNPRGISSMTLDNCGNWGAATPLSASIGLATNLVVTGSAVAEMRGAIPIFSNLVVAAGGVVTSGDNDTNLSLALLGNLSVAADAGIVADAKGFARDSGPGHGTALSNQGAGGSYGGWGGDSASGAWSGSTYGSASRPVDRGSGGGSGSGYPAAGSEGGGAIRLTVAGTTDLNGLLSANGGMGWQDDAGGGSGGSIWLSARRFTGDGALAAIGGDGDFFGGGGGGGGRIAIYAPTNTFTGFVSVRGGDGVNCGTAGTIFTSGSLDGIDVVAQTPTGIVSNIVNQIALEFTEPVNLTSVSASDVRIYTPYGLLPGTNQTYSSPSPTTLLVSFNPQNVPGNYRVEVGPLIEGLLAPRMSQVYTGAFSIVLPMISGTVTNLAGQPVPGVTLSPDGGLIEATTDANGNYSIGVAPGWGGTVTPALGTNAFVPGRLSYTNVSASVASRNYLMVPTVAPTLTSSVSASGLSLSWGGLPGVLYQPESSTNLVNWSPYGPPLPGTNGLMHLLVPTDADPLKFVRLRAVY
ncbi:MAG TPA: carboxypeptidase-like regulatory domain-containing protein [Verrucomicrobiae bacterium]|nr:carboxypeptidase-like regulatory domain-containing protein [Verrucomicrobiae bacterium]